MEFIICLGTISFFLLLFGFLVIWRYFNYLETKTLAEKGLVKPQREIPVSKNQPMLVWGIIISGIGVALSLGLLPVGRTGTGSMYPFGLGPWMLFGYIPLFFGLSLVLASVFMRNGKPEQKSDDLPPDSAKEE